VEQRFNLDVQDGFELRAMITAAETVVHAALERTESRGAHQRDDFPLSDYQLIKNQVLELRDEELVCRWAQPARLDRNQLENPLVP
jgi:succinate dehydrogenase / fumarate reductase flavoprotein subunit/fumarate reductase (CoM/CoB) subunit A